MHTTIIIRAELSGSHSARAAGITAHGPSPLVALCRKLLAASVNPGRPLLVFRGGSLVLRIRSIGEAASLEAAA